MRWPTTTPRSMSCTAPDTISAALAWVRVRIRVRVRVRVRVRRVAGARAEGPRHGAMGPGATWLLGVGSSAGPHSAGLGAVPRRRPGWQAAAPPRERPQRTGWPSASPSTKRTRCSTPYNRALCRAMAICGQRRGTEDAEGTEGIEGAEGAEGAEGGEDAEGAGRYSPSSGRCRWPAPRPSGQPAPAG